MKKAGLFSVPYYNVTNLAHAMSTVLRSLTRSISSSHNRLVEVVNFNAITEYDQNSQPTIAEGKLAIWKDADATTGNPTHYLMYNQDGTTVTFASEETVP